MSGWASLGARVEVSGLSPAEKGALRALWEGGGLNPDLNPAGVSPRLSVSAGPLPPTPEAGPGATRQTLDVMGQAVEVWTRGDELWLGGELYVRVESGGGVITAAPGPVSPAAWLLALTELHRAGGWLPLHAVVLGAGDRAFAVTGVSGAGKSTLALRLLEAGAEVLAEDRAFWHAPSGQVTGLDRALRVFDGSVERFAPALRPGLAGAERDPRGKALLPLPPGSAPRPLVGLALLTPTPAPPLSGAERVRSLWETTGVPLTAQGRAAAQRGVAALAPLYAPQPLSRDEAPGVVLGALGLPSP